MNGVRKRRLPYHLGGVNTAAVAVNSNLANAISITMNAGEDFIITKFRLRYLDTTGYDAMRIQIRDTQRNRMLVDGDVQFGSLGRRLTQGGSDAPWNQLEDPIVLKSGQKVDIFVTTQAVQLAAYALNVTLGGYQEAG